MTPSADETRPVERSGSASSAGGASGAGRASSAGDNSPTDASGAPLVSDTIVCIDCGSTAHLLTRPDDTGRFWPGDLVTYRCEDCMDRWDLIVPGDEDEADPDPW